MDILAARKKAAEQAQAQKAAEAALRGEMLTAPTEAPIQTPDSPAPKTTPGPTEQQVLQPPPQVVAEKLEAPAENRPEETRTQEIEMLSFRLSGEEYAVMVAD